jgi:uncharacterized membrane protein
MGLRAVVWKPTPGPFTTSLAAVVGWFVLLVIATGLGDYALAAPPVRFEIYGVTAVAGLAALSLVIAAFFVRPDARTSALVAFSILWMVVTGLQTLYGLIPAPLLERVSTFAEIVHATPAQLFFYVELVWWLGAILAILRSVQAERWPKTCLRLAGLYAALLIATVVFPNQPIFQGRDFDLRKANWWEYIAAAREGRLSDEEPRRKSPIRPRHVELMQPRLLDEAASALAPQRPGVTDIYTIGAAAWAEQDVFLKELDGAIESLGRSLPIEDRVLRLVNHPDTVAGTPIMTRQNFAAAVHAVARVMNKDEDVLLLFLTSHGSPAGVAMEFDSLAYGSLSPRDVATVLDSEGIKNRILIVSACYSGVFVTPDLADDRSIVLTAADENNPSFGCSNERDWTYFGDALFNQSLTGGRDLERAFEAAKALIAEWETRDHLSHSNPQGHFGPALMERLAPLYRAAPSAELAAPPN